MSPAIAICVYFFDHLIEETRWGSLMSEVRHYLDWSEVAVAMDRGLRIFADFVKPILDAHSADNMSITTLLFLVSIGEDEARVNDLVRRGRYVGSNASYALKALTEGGFISRRQDPADKRNAIVSCTPRGLSLVIAVKTACNGKSAAARDAIKSIKTFEEYCMKLPV